MVWSRFADEVRSREARHNLRRRSCIEAENATQIKVAGKCYLNFSSNDYLGLSQHPDVLRSLTGSEPAGSGGSSLVTGYHRVHRELEDSLCEWLDYPAALLFSSGFAANHGVLSAILKSSDVVIQDKFNHASLIDGARHSGATLTRFKHNDMVHLQQRLQAASPATTMTVTEGVFSMDGDQADLTTFVDLSRQANALSMVDDAHGIGLFGASGQGSCAGLAQKPDILMVTFGKALGTSGACVLASRAIIDYLLQSCRDYIYSTAMSPMLAAATAKSIQICQEQSSIREKLHGNIEYFKGLVNQKGLPVLPSNSAIQPVIIGDSANTLRKSELLRSQGLWLTAIRPPTVPDKTSRLRVTLSASHSRQDILSLANHLEQLEE